MLDTKLERILEHERACSNLLASERKKLRLTERVANGEHSFNTPKTYGKLGELMTPRQGYIIEVMQRDIGELKLKLMSEIEKKDTALDDSYLYKREIEAMKKEIKGLKDKLEVERRVNNGLDNRVNLLHERLRKHTG
jgi:late competence protein required for DNA uptake (superfamily II DNA/RNA helicase)